MKVEQVCLEQESSEEGTIQVKGYGKVTLSQAKGGAINRIKSTLEKLSNNPDDPAAWRSAKALFSNGVTEAMIDAVISGM